MSKEMILMDNVTKIYSNGFVANKDITFSVKKGEIHGLVGENGAGKTTLMKMLFGIELPEEGKIYIKGEEVKIADPLHAIALGIGMVHQHFMLVPSLTVAENIVLGIEPKRGISFDFNKAVEMTKEVSAKYNLKVDPKAIVEDLPVGFKQKVEILKALIRGADVLVLDEPTAVLTPQETEELFIELKNLKEQGHTIVFISHKLNEVKEICDRVTVLRNGRLIGVEDIKEVSEQDISRMMVGRDVILKIEKEKSKPKEVVLKVNDVTLKAEEKYTLKNINFTVRKGEILGIVGVEGNGQKELSEIITGMLSDFGGSITVNNANIKGLSIREIRELGISHISEDRMTYGCAPNGSILDNIISERYYKKEFNKGILLDIKKSIGLVKQYIKDYTIKCDEYSQPVRMLSGGNIQKVVVAREFTSDMSLIIANQPTRGIDVGATEFIRRRLIEISRQNDVGVLLISADLNEAIETSDSIVVMSNGEIVAYFDDLTNITEFELGEYMLGLKKQDIEEIGGAVYE